MNKVASASNLRPGQANRAARFPRKAYACSLVAAVVLVLGSMMRSGVQPRQPTLVRGHAAAAVNQTVQTAASKGETPSGASVLWPSSDVTDDVVDAEAAALALEEEEAEQHREQEDAAVQPAATQQRRQDPPVRRSAEGASHRKAEEEEEGEEVDAANSDLAASPPPAAASAANSPAAQEAGTGEGQVPASQHVPAATGKQDATASHKQTVAGLEGGEEAPAPQEAEPADSVAGRGREAAAPPAAYVLPADAVPKVALMFLSRGWLPHKTVWHEWMKGVDGGVLPVPAVRACMCCWAPAAAGGAPAACRVHVMLLFVPAGCLCYACTPPVLPAHCATCFTVPPPLPLARSWPAWGAARSRWTLCRRWAQRMQVQRSRRTKQERRHEKAGRRKRIQKKRRIRQSMGKRRRAAVAAAKAQAAAKAARAGAAPSTSASDFSLYMCTPLQTTRCLSTRTGVVSVLV